MQSKFLKLCRLISKNSDILQRNVDINHKLIKKTQIYDNFYGLLTKSNTKFQDFMSQARLHVAFIRVITPHKILGTNIGRQ